MANLESAENLNQDHKQVSSTLKTEQVELPPQEILYSPKEKSVVVLSGCGTAVSFILGGGVLIAIGAGPFDEAIRNKDILHAAAWAIPIIMGLLLAIHGASENTTGFDQQ